MQKIRLPHTNSLKSDHISHKQKCDGVWHPLMKCAEEYSVSLADQKRNRTASSWMHVGVEYLPTVADHTRQIYSNISISIICPNASSLSHSACYSSKNIMSISFEAFSAVEISL